MAFGKDEPASSLARPKTRVPRPRHAAALAPAAALSLFAGLLAATAVAATSGGFDVAIGKAVFDRLWVAAPASTKSADGLGPLFAARSCGGCHAASGGRTTFRLGRDDPAAHPGLVIRLGDAAGRPDPVYGAQLQPGGMGAAPGEGRPTVSFAAAKAGTLQKPEWRVADWGYAAPDAATRASPRVAPSLAGVGLLARVPEAAILTREDPDDRDGDGVSGRASRVGGALGRFGWKAAEPTLEAQAAAAFALDLGLSSALRPDPAGDCTAAEPQCRDAPHGAEPGQAEVGPELMAGLVAFLDRRPAPTSPKTRPKGARAFAAAGCAACHVQNLSVAGGGTAAAYTDLLLHDLGPGLDDGMGEGAAKSAEWRTAPLWGLSHALAQGSGLMHDGRAATVADAIRWHDGEAAGARGRFDALPDRERRALLDFVAGL